MGTCNCVVEQDQLKENETKLYGVSGQDSVKYLYTSPIYHTAPNLIMAPKFFPSNLKENKNIPAQDHKKLELDSHKGLEEPTQPNKQNQVEANLAGINKAPKQSEGTETKINQIEKDQRFDSKKKNLNRFMTSNQQSEARHKESKVKANGTISIVGNIADDFDSMEEGTSWVNIRGGNKPVQTATEVCSEIGVLVSKNGDFGAITSIAE